MHALLALALLTAQAQRPIIPVAIDQDTVLATVPRESMGIAVAVWDANMLDAESIRLVKDGGFQVIRYPGGSYADIYHWKNHTATKGLDATVRPGTDFDHFMTLVKKSGTTPLITVNYGSNEEGTGGADPAEAADWVRSARKKHYGVKYWEIGNEVYGNGFYNGQGWEEDLHAPDTKKKGDRLQNPKLGPTEYANNLLKFIDAMKKEDRSIKIGAILTCPGGWPDGVAPDWNRTVLGIAGSKIDFVVVHWYGEGKSPEESLNTLKKVPPIVGKLRSLIGEFCGSRAKDVKIWMTEGDCSGYNTRAPGGLFAADHFLTWWESGADHVNWWNLHNGAVTTFDGTLDDQGILSNGSTVKGMKEPPANTAFPPYYGAKMVGLFTKPGDKLLRVTCSSDSLRLHAVLRRDGGINLMVINESPLAPAHISLQGFGKATVRYSYSKDANQIEKENPAESLSAYGVSPYSVTVFVFPPAHLK